MELVKRPAILLLDEPTSGLDSASAFGVMQRLKAMARAGHAIALTIHQPSSELWALFDNVLLLSGGHTALRRRGETANQRRSGFICVIRRPRSVARHLHTETRGEPSRNLPAGGHTVFYGKAAEIPSYLAAHGHACPPMYNPADFMLQLVNSDFPERYDAALVLKYGDSAERAAVVAKVAEAMASSKTVNSASSHLKL